MSSCPRVELPRLMDTKENILRTIIFYANQMLSTIVICYRDFSCLPAAGIALTDRKVCSVLYNSDLYPLPSVRSPLLELKILSTSTFARWSQTIIGLVSLLRCILWRNPYCQDWFFTDLIFWGVRGSGHGLAVRLKGYVAWSCFPKGRKADRGLRQGVRDYLVSDRTPCMSVGESSILTTTTKRVLSPLE